MVHDINERTLMSSDFQISFVGLDGVGKTKIIQRLINEPITDVTFSTHGVTREILDLEGVKLALTDLGGKEVFRNSLWKTYISYSDALVYVVDATKKETLEESKTWFSKAMKWKKTNSPSLLILNPWDTPIDQTTINDLKDYFCSSISNERTSFLVMSPLSNENVDIAKDWMAKTIIDTLISQNISVEIFIAYIKTKDGIIEAKISSPKTKDKTYDIVSPIIRYKFAPKSEKLLEYMRISGHQIVMAANEEISCWLITTKNSLRKESSLLMKLMTEFVKDMQGLKPSKTAHLSETDLNRFLINNMIDNQLFWSQTSNTPMFEITYIPEE